MSAEEAKKTEKAPEKKIEQDSKPTNCPQCNKRIRRKNWYYLNGRFYCSKGCAKTHWKKLSDEKQKKIAEAAAAAPQAQSAPAAAEIKPPEAQKSLS